MLGVSQQFSLLEANALTSLRERFARNAGVASDGPLLNLAVRLTVRRADGTSPRRAMTDMRAAFCLCFSHQKARDKKRDSLEKRDCAFFSILELFP